MFLRVLAFWAIGITIANVNQTCMYWIYQDEIPELARKYRKF
ncbi:MAG: cyclic lactone autoinducer peptide [Lachnospiraceae bacterium]|nr:cyclic lactone autoinducer peptide [Clostridia bacterium]MBQ3512503.1 cyclic lactone autoinducer peptide [Lachnospiraceae bacterium]